MPGTLRVQGLPKVGESGWTGVGEGHAAWPTRSTQRLCRNAFVFEWASMVTMVLLMVTVRRIDAGKGTAMGARMVTDTGVCSTRGIGGNMALQAVLLFQFARTT